MNEREELLKTRRDPALCREPARSSMGLYLHYISLKLREIMEYKASFILTVLGQFLVSFQVFLGIYFLMERFHQVMGYTYGEVVLCYGIFLLGYSLAECISRGFDAFSRMVRQGTFDRIMLRPRSTVLQILGSGFELNRLGHLLQAAVMFAYGVYVSDVSWTFFRALAVICMLIGGALLFTGLFMIYAALCFFTLEGLEFMNVFTDGAKEYGKYPIDVYGKRIMRLCTFVVPYTLVQYYPLQYVLGRSQNGLLIIAPLGTILFLGLCAIVWRAGIRHYQSAGS